MVDIRRMLRQGSAGVPSGIEIRAHSAGVLVIFPGGRKQVVSVQSIGDHIVIISRVLGKAKIDGMGRASLLPQVWKRNRKTRCIAYGFDARGRLIGRIEQVTATLQPEELVFYIALLARDCDQFEFALTGVDLS